MRRLLAILPVAALWVLPAGPALAWGAMGHRLLAQAAAEAFPAELPAFLRTPVAVWDLGELSREPDRNRSGGQPHDADLDPGHQTNIDDQGMIVAGLSIDALPPNREAYEKALQAAGTSSWRAGWLPYNIMDGYQELVKDFAYWRADVIGEKSGKTAQQRDWFTRDRLLHERVIIHDLGYWSHFVGDGSQPLHISIHYNGWGAYPNPKSYTQEHIHAPFEGAFVQDNLALADVKAAMPAPEADCNCNLQAQTIQYLKTTLSYTEPLYQLWDQGAFKPKDPRGIAFVAQRLGFGAGELRDLVVQAWRDSLKSNVGYPPVPMQTVITTGVAPYEQMVGTD